MRLSLHHPAVTIIILAAGIGQLAAKNKPKQPKATPQDQISVSGHIVVSGGPILRFIATQHYDRSYVYAERAPGQPITILDVTKPNQPVIVSQFDASSGATNLVAVAGTAALSGTAITPVNSSADTAKLSVQTIRLMDLSDPASPKVTRQFDGVTAVEKLGGLILLANPEGVWVLSQHLADDPKMDERYARKVIYGESMY
jgi:hypothetical protein